MTLGVFQFWSAYEKHKKIEQGIPNQFHNPVLSAILGFVMIVFGAAILISGIVSAARVSPVRGISITHLILGLIYMSIGCSAFGPLVMSFLNGPAQKKLVIGSAITFLVCLLFGMSYELISLNM
jgi:hypothetical protein